MPAPKENRFWELRSKHGRDKLFDNPLLLWEAACEYFCWCEDTPLIEIDFRGKENEEVKLPKMRAFTMSALCLYLGCNENYFRNFKFQDRVDKEDFSMVIEAIKQTMYSQKLTGAAAGLLNANIISRDLGLKDIKEIDNNNLNRNIEITKSDADALRKENDSNF